METALLVSIIGSIIASFIFKAVENQVTALVKAIKKNPYETFVIVSLCFVIAGMVKLAFLQG